MLIWGTGYDAMKVGNNQASFFAELGWYGLPGGAAPGAMRVQTNGRFSGQCLAMDNSSVTSTLTQASKLLPAGKQFTTFYEGVAQYIPANAADINHPFIGVGRTGVCQLSVVFKDFGQIELWQGRTGFVGAVLLATSDPGSFLEDTWNYIEIGGLLSAVTSGHIIVKVNTVPVISVVSSITNASGQPGNSFMVGYAKAGGVGAGAIGILWDDVYFCDETGTENNTFLGNTRAPALVPAAPGSSTMFTPVPAMTPNWQAASNKDVDDSSYVYSPNIGDLDLYKLGPLLNSPQVFGVQISGAYRQDDATQRSAANVIKSGGTTVVGPDFFMGANYAFQTDMYEDDPATTVPWVYSAVNLIEIGPKVTS